MIFDYIVKLVVKFCHLTYAVYFGPYATGALSQEVGDPLHHPPRRPSPAARLLLPRPAVCTSPAGCPDLVPGNHT